MMKIVLDAGYSGWVGIEYEGKALPEAEGILATKKLLERVRDELAARP
jgi:hydroxypyruvate isomerase